jgi:hypothetical protein
MKIFFGNENWKERTQGLIGKSEEKKPNLTKREILELICHLQGWDMNSDLAVSLNKSLIAKATCSILTLPVAVLNIC